MFTKRKIVAVTGARSEYDLLSPIFNRLKGDPRFELSLIVTGAHLSDFFGKTINEIIKDDLLISDRIYNLINTNDKIGRIVSIGNQINGIAQSLNNLQPDIVLVAGDREEAISTTMSAAFLDIPVAHFFGGDIAKDGNIDNSVRYAASKFAHIHFTTLESHKQNLIKLGEEEFRIFVIGNPGLDKFFETEYLPKEEVTTNIGMTIKGNDKYCVLIQHPIINEVEEQSKHIRHTLDAILESGMKCFINYPNSDAGYFPIIEAYNEYTSKFSNLKLFNNLDRVNYINLLRYASCLLGNSSSGILEAPTLHLPVINIGNRQRGRFSSNNVIFVDNDKEQIIKAINKALYDSEFISLIKNTPNPYGDGNSSNKVVEILSSIELNNKLIYKNITY